VGALLSCAAPCVFPQVAEAAALDPNIPMHTIETPHFRVNYPEGYDRIAQKAAQFAEDAHDKVSAYFGGVVPKNKTEFTLFDHEDTVNGLALPYVNNAMYIYLTTPDADLRWGRYDDWLKLVIIHEYTHVLHFEVVDGFPSVLNSIFGRILFPNLFQPTFLIEGLAVTTESMFTSEGKGGRLHDGDYDMLLRADVLANRQLSIDQAGGYYLTDFPGGDTPYVYGTFFYKYIVNTYGADKPPLIAHEYSKAPWLGIDHAVRQVIPGRDAQQIFDEMLHWERRRALMQIEEIKKKPLTQTTAVTTTSHHHHHPEYRMNGNLMFIEGLRHSPTGLFEMTGKDEAGKPVLKRLFNKGQYGDYEATRDGKSIYYHNSRGPNNYSSSDDIYRYDFATGARTNLTNFLRVNNPGVSPDGEKIVAVKNGRGQNNLWLFDKAGKVLKRLTALDDNTQFTAPRWSPDGKKVVMSAWRNASRDLFMLDTETWQVVPMWKDDAVDVGPVWSPDGKYIVFCSDRDNHIWNLYAYDWQAKALFQMTNVLTGAIEPAVHPEGKEVAFALATGTGFDIHTIPWDPSKWWRVPTPIFDKSIKPLEFTQKQDYESHPYNPLPSMMPKFWSPIYMSGLNVAGAFTIGYDVLLTNTVFAMGGYSVQQPTNLPDGSALNPLDLSMHQFLYQNSQWDTNVSLFGSGFASKYGIPLSTGDTLNLYQRYDTYSLSFAWNNVPSPLTNASYQTGDITTLGLNYRNISDMTPKAINDEAVKAKLMPQAGRSHSVSLTYKANDNGKYGYSVGPEYGSMTTYGAEVAHPLMLSQTEYYRFFADWRKYMPMPWTHHTLGFRGLAGINLGKPQGDFYLGGSRSVNMAGTPDIRVAAEPDDVLVALRGYPFASSTGNTVGLLSTEYRFPILEIQHGAGTLPLFAERVAGSFFVDSGVAFNNSWKSTILGQTPATTDKLYPALGDLRAGVGAEVRLNFKIANNPLNTTPLATIARSAVNQLNAFNDSSGIFRLGIAQPALPLTGANGQAQWLGPSVYTEFGTFF
jgi:hypothetical protein